jgi:hypothetical protein
MHSGSPPPLVGEVGTQACREGDSPLAPCFPSVAKAAGEEMALYNAGRSKAA